MQIKRFELIPKVGVKVLEKDFVLKQGMSYEEIVAVLGMVDRDVTNIINLPKKSFVTRKLSFSNLWLNVELEEGKLVFIESFDNSGFFFNGIDLSGKDYKRTISMLRNIGYNYKYFRDNTYEYPDINLFLFINEEGLETLGFYADNFYDKIENIFLKFNIVKREKEGNTVNFYLDYKDKK